MCSSHTSRRDIVHPNETTIVGKVGKPVLLRWCSHMTARLQSTHLHVGVEGLPEGGGDAEPAEPAEAVLEDPVDGRRGRQGALRTDAHRREQ